MDLKYILNSPDVERIASSLETIATDAGAAITGKVSKQQSIADAGKALVIGPDGIVAAGGAVRYDIAQSMTAAQQGVARGNIAAASADLLASLNGIAVTVTPRTFADAQKANARANIDAVKMTLSGNTLILDG